MNIQKFDILYAIEPNDKLWVTKVVILIKTFRLTNLRLTTYDLKTYDLVTQDLKTYDLKTYDLRLTTCDLQLKDLQTYYLLLYLPLTNTTQRLFSQRVRAHRDNSR